MARKKEAGAARLRQKQEAAAAKQAAEAEAAKQLAAEEEEAVQKQGCIRLADLQDAAVWQGDL